MHGLQTSVLFSASTKPVFGYWDVLCSTAQGTENHAVQYPILAVQGAATTFDASITNNRETDGILQR